PRDKATLDLDAVRPHNYTQFFMGTKGFKHMLLGVVRRGIFYNYRYGNIYGNISQEQIDSANDAIKLKYYGAHIHNPADIESIDEIQQGDAEYLVELTEFKQNIANYLSELHHTKLRTLANLIHYNNKHKALEFSEYMPDQIVFEDAQNTTGYNSLEYQAALATCLRLGRTQGIDRTLEKYNLDALIMTGDSAPSAAAIAGYPIMSVPLGYLTENNGINKTIAGTPYGLLFTGRA
ncbi:unnamed protein product, partial [Didymodactylos carnosus]